MRTKSRKTKGQRRFVALALTGLILAGFTRAGAASPLWTGGTAAGFDGGTGSESDPYLISTGEQLAYLSQSVNGGNTYAGQYIRLTQDILLNTMNPDGTFASGSPRNFTRIGSGASRSFLGCFDGGGFEIIGLYVSQSGTAYQGLFGYAGTGSVIRNLRVSGSVAGAEKTGAVAGFSNGLIENCVSACRVTANWQDYHGGIAGYAGVNSEITGCGVTASVEGGTYTGGIVGYTEGRVAACTVSGAVSNGWSDYHGGIAGFASAGSRISGCTAEGPVTGANSIGGIAGCTAGTIDDCSAAAVTVSGQMKVGGVLGGTQGAGVVITNCRVSGTVSASGDYVGGVAGRFAGIIENCNLTVAVDGKCGYSGGIAGFLEGAESRITGCTASVTVQNHSGSSGGAAGVSQGEISGCIISGTVSGKSNNIGGVVGHSAGAASKVILCTVSCTIIAEAGYGYVGGVAGQTDGVITQCTVTGPVTGNDQHYVGGIAGNAAAGSEISKCTSSGAITGNGIVGGIAGASDGTVTICINTGDVSGQKDGRAGGIVGKAGAGADISHSYNSGAVTGGGPGGIGGIAGYIDGAAVIHNNLNKGTVDGNQYVGSITGNTANAENAWNNYYWDYPGAPAGTNTGDIQEEDGAVPVGDLTWDEIWDLLNNDRGEIVDIWEPDADDDGVPKPTIMPAQVRVTQAAVWEGKRYAPGAPGSGMEAVITADSAFTVSYTVKYTEACGLAAQMFRLAGGEQDAVLPAGTSVIMLADGQYYYINLTAPATEIILGSFIKMGGSETYDGGTAESDTVKDYLFIVDLTKTAGGLAPGTYQALLTDGAGKSGGTMPAVTVTGSNAYALVALSGTNAFSVSFNKNTVSGYDAKTADFPFAFEVSIKAADGGSVLWPMGTRINNQVLTADLPFVFIREEDAGSVRIDMSGCPNPLAGGSYTLYVTAYTGAPDKSPRGGYPLSQGTAVLTVTEPVAYGIRADAPNRFIDAAAASVEYRIQTLGGSTVKSTLQRKYGVTYQDVAGEIDKPVYIGNGGSATVSLPSGISKGTYRVVFSLYDDSGVIRATAKQNIIVK
jgi:hypothetical protein